MRSSAKTKSTKPDVSSLPEESEWWKLCSLGTGDMPWGKWNCQYRAYHFAAKYLKSPIPKNPGDLKAALIRMPTGSGKTGVMALIANYAMAGSDVLIVVPSEYLTGQIRDALNMGYWQALGKRPTGGPKLGVEFVPSTLKRTLDEEVSGSRVFIGTTQTLAMLFASDSPEENPHWTFAYAELKKRVGVVLVDEGHREPASIWAKAVRAFHRHIILFSATPYRNDLRMFRIGYGPDYRFSLRYHEAVKAYVVRAVEFRVPIRNFVSLNKDTNRKDRDVSAFVDSLLDFYRYVRRNKPPEVSLPKVIVRCESIASVREVLHELRQALKSFSPSEGLSAIAIHEELTGKTSEGEFTQPPKPEEQEAKADFWIHQFKLTEGIDKPEFCAVAFYEPFMNSRSLVQQIGRVLRNRLANRTATAFVLADPLDALDNEWQSYLSFEQSTQDVIGAEDIVEAIRLAQPKWFYAGGRYRKGASFEREEILSDLRIASSARIYLRPKWFDFDKIRALAAELSEQMEENDLASVGYVERGERSIILLHWEVVQSERLEESGFFNIQLVATCLYANQDYIFHNGRLGLNSLRSGSELEPVDVDTLTRLVPQRGTILKQLSLVNCDLGDSAVRRRALGGRSLAYSATSLNDHLHFIASILINNTRLSRHVGLQRSGVVDRNADLLPLEQFETWCDTISRQLNHRTIRHHILRRYAQAVRAPKSAEAAHLLLDLSDFWGEFKPLKSSGLFDAFSEDFQAVACDVDETGGFSCDIGDKAISGLLQYRGKRFHLISPQLNETFTRRLNERRKPSTFLSQPTVMRVVTKNRLIYADRRFYNPSRLHGPDRVTNLDLIVSVPGLENISKKEKGKEPGFEFENGKPVSWEEGSLFHFIDRRNGIFEKCHFNKDILVCDDLGSEIADFIAVDCARKKLALIHAKVFEKAGSLSAKAMQVVASQAKKNLAFIDPSETIRPSQGDLWDREWRWRRDADVGIPRIRCSNTLPSGGAIMDEIRKLLLSTSVQKEVWLVIGNGFSERDLKRIVHMGDNIEFYWLQLLYLIHSCNAAVTAIGARLKIVTGV